MLVILSSAPGLTPGDIVSIDVLFHLYYLRSCDDLVVGSMNLPHSLVVGHAADAKLATLVCLKKSVSKPVIQIKNALSC